MVGQFCFNGHFGSTGTPDRPAIDKMRPPSEILRDRLSPYAARSAAHASAIFSKPHGPSMAASRKRTMRSLGRVAVCVQRCCVPLGIWAQSGLLARAGSLGPDVDIARGWRVDMVAEDSVERNVVVALTTCA